MWEKEISAIKKEFAGWGYKVNEHASDKEINGYSFNGLFVYGIDEDLLNKAPNGTIAGFIEYNDSLK